MRQDDRAGEGEMTTETLDKLYLEWSQFTKARTSREIAMENALRWVLNNLGAHPKNIQAVAKEGLGE